VTTIKRKQFDDDITVEHGSVLVFRQGYNGEFTIKVARVARGSYNELRIYADNSGVETTTDKLVLLQGAIAEMLSELHKRGVRS